MLTREHLDRITVEGCGMPGCEENHSTLFLHSRCHIKAGVLAEVCEFDPVIHIVCAKCRGHIGDVALAKKPPAAVVFETEGLCCRKWRKHQVSYAHGSGVLVIACAECQKVVGELAVAEEANALP
jgi:hypothetical protein